MAKTDKKTLELIKEVERQRAEIKRLDKPNWRTNCSLQIDGSTINLHVESDIAVLINAAARLKRQESDYNEMAKELGIEAPTLYYGSATFADWLTDIKSRIDKIQINTKKKKLETLEARLNSIVSPELRAELTLAEIEKEMGSVKETKETKEA